MTFDDLLALARLTFRNPREAVRVLQSLDLPMSARWMALAVSVLLSTILMSLTIQARPEAVMPILRDVAMQPLSYVLMQLTALAIGTWLVTGMGRAMGGQGSFADVLLVVAWIEMLLLSAQTVQAGVLLVSPLLASLVGLVTTAMIAWISVQLIRAVHGIENVFLVLLGLMGAFAMTILLLSVIAAVFGLMPDVPAEVQS